jgi:hypothetical protein
MSKPILPTQAQEATCLRICVNLTRFYLSINLVRLDVRNGEIYLLAGDEIGIIVQKDGIWRYD